MNTASYNGRTISFARSGMEHFEGGEGPIMVKNFDIKPDEVFVDVGASDSAWTLYALASGASVLAFEPSHPQYRLIIEDLLVNPGFLERCKIFNIGLDHSDRVRTLADWYIEIGGAENLEITPDCTVPTRFLPLDHFLPELTRLDWIKMDVEGGEYYVMLGGEKAIQRFRPSFIIENHSQIVRIGDWMRANDIVKKIYTMLENLNYDIYEDTCQNTQGRTFIVARPRKAA